MKISKHFEQATYVLLLLATQKNHTPLKSSTLSRLLQVSDSSLKKILRKLVVADLITSSASKDGGFKLKQAIGSITLLAVLEAVEETPLIAYKNSQLAQEIFPNKAHTLESEQIVTQAILQGEQNFKQAFAPITLDQLLEADSIQFGAIDWTEK